MGAVDVLILRRLGIAGSTHIRHLRHLRPCILPVSESVFLLVMLWNIFRNVSGGTHKYMTITAKHIAGQFSTRKSSGHSKKFSRFRCACFEAGASACHLPPLVISPLKLTALYHFASAACALSLVARTMPILSFLISCFCNEPCNFSCDACHNVHLQVLICELRFRISFYVLYSLRNGSI